MTTPQPGVLPRPFLQMRQWRRVPTVGTRAALLVVFALFLAACSSAVLERQSGAPESGAEGRASVEPVTGMDGRPPLEATASPQPPPEWMGGSVGDEPGPNGPPAAIVPDVRGMVFADAVHRLWQTGIGFGLVYARPSDRTRWSVLEQNPPPGSDTPNSGEIDLVLSMRGQESAGTMGTVRCKPTVANLSDPYCLGKLLKY
jgi:hypothetical protein